MDYKKEYSELARTCAKMCSISYRDPYKIKTIIKDKIIISGDTYSWKFYDRNETQAYTFENSEYLFIVFRGTSETADAKLLMKLESKREDEIKRRIYRGLREYVDNVFPFINETARCASGKKIIVTGHSLGAAAAKLVSVKLKLDLTCITFAEPKSFKRKIGKEPNKKYIRILNYGDIVPFLPFSYNYGVPEEEVIYFNRTGKIVMNPRKRKIYTDLLSSIVDSGLLNIVNLIKNSSLKQVDSHIISTYLKLVDSQI